VCNASFRPSFRIRWLLDPDRVLDHAVLLQRLGEVGAEDAALGVIARLQVHMDAKVAGESGVAVNLRAPWWNASDIPSILRRARWVKLNDDELAIIAGIFGCQADDLMEMARYVRETCDIHLLIVTRGARGAVALDESGKAFSVAPEGSNREIVDTVGAGDAFSAMIIMGLLHGWSLPVMMEKAQAFAGRICGLRGAIATDSDFYH